MSRLEELTRFVEQVYPDLDLYSYYQLLEVDPQAERADIRTAFYRQAARLHPDRFAGLRDGQVRAKLVAIYARVAEAYKVLSDAKKRASYDAGIAGGELRYVELSRERAGPPSPEDAVERAETKKFLRLALTALHSGDRKGAHMNFKFALAYEPENAYLKQQLEAVEEQLKGHGSKPPRTELGK
ncbi:MAG TPA: DnaJ domain-containing protein [Polyangia bacterium]|nr:DnaJ domain-containing protein [Polyangia bacterium]